MLILKYKVNVFAEENMKVKLFRLFFILLIGALSAFLFACEPVDGGDSEVKVMVSLGEGASVEGQNPLSVKKGQDAVFKIILDENYIVESADGAVYDEKTGTLTVSNVQAKTNVNLVTRARKTFTVAIVADTHIRIADGGATSVEVKEGDGVEFALVFDEGYSLTYVSLAECDFDYDTGVLSLASVTADHNIILESALVNIDTSASYRYVFRGEERDTTSIPMSSAIYSGTPITVKAGDMARAFGGWMVTGKGIVSTSRTYTFNISEDTVISPVYTDIDTLVYDANGGKINKTSSNLSRSDLYTVTVKSNRVSVKMSKDYLDYMESASTFYDDKSFTKDGYILIEYNTKADGSGDAYSIGSKFPLLQINEDMPVLYCIWAKASAENLFTVEDYSNPLPSTTTAARAPHWVSEGVKITSYLGNEKTVVIPEKIGGKTVVAIGEGAFSGKSMTTLVMGGNVFVVEDGAFSGCGALSTMYFPDSMYQMNNEALDAASMKNLAHIYVNATMAPRYSKSGDAKFAAKLSRVLAGKYDDMVIIVAGSSVYQGFGTEYMEALLGGDYRVVNFGTTRTTNGAMYLEAMGALADEGDVVIYAPENSSYMFGEGELYWKTLRDLEGMYNIFRYVDMRNYDNFFGAFTDFNQTNRYKRNIDNYENICKASYMNKYGDYIYAGREQVADGEGYRDVYYITMNERIKSKYESKPGGNWDDKEYQEQNKDYTDMSNITWCSFTEESFVKLMNHSIAKAKSGGATVYFGFCPVDASKLVDEAKSVEAFYAYDELILDTFNFDGILGNSINYAYAHVYLYDNAFHLNDVGRAYRTYRVYLDLCQKLGITDVKKFTEVGTSFEGCIFEQGSDGTPLTPSGVGE